MSRLLAALLTILVGTALPASSPAYATELELTSIPSSLANSDKQLWRKVMAEFYGKYDKKQKCWIGKSDGKSWCMRPHTLNRVSNGTATLYYMAIGGQQLGGNNECHACTGVLALLVLSDAKPALAIVARGGKYLDYGSWGRVPPEENFTFHRLGAPNTFAWTIENGWSGQGITVTWTDIFGVIGDQVKSLGQLPRSFSDDGNCENGINMMTQEKCSDVSFETTYEADKTSEAFASILLKGSGTLKGQPFTNTYRVDFNSAAQSYPEPSDLPDAIKP